MRSREYTPPPAASSGGAMLLLDGRAYTVHRELAARIVALLELIERGGAA